MPVRKPTKKVCRGADKVHVVVRVRPISSAEQKEGSGATLAVDDVAHVVESFAFDRVFVGSSEQRSIFVESVLPTVDSWLEGYNGCVFAYGQTGSGKTYTMLGPDGGKKDLTGVIPQAVAYALDRVAHEERQAKALSSLPSQFQLRASYIEVYNDELRDLLGNGTEDLKIRETSNGVVYVEGCAYEKVKSVEDVVAAIERGAKRRSTGRTNMNEHSSRSHAVFALHLEHRWKDESCVKSGNPRAFKMKTAILNLIDLAGSEYAKKTGNEGQQMKESIAINSGLFALGNVIASLAGHRDRRVGDHIPYRDSVLTRLLQSSLGGDSRTVMLACVSPAECNLQESLGTLRYAASARTITNRATLQIEDLEDDPEPLDNDLADPEEELDRRTVWIDTATAGDVFARCIGDESGELVLFVHGSGPTNSSTWWAGIMWELYVTSPQPLYCVAIDCPGYGRSKGDRQTIRSYPGAFLMDVVRCLGKEDALCVVGSSQGACAVFNAVLEYPKIARHVTVMDPVGHDVFRYKAIRQPCLLMFDTEDAGHPVKVGRWMRDNIPDCTYFEWAGSKEPYWHCDHMVPEMIKMFNKTWSKPGGGRAPAASAVVGDTLATMVRLAGGLIGWAENQGFGQSLKQIDEGLLLPPSRFIHDELGEEMVRQLTVSSDTASTFSGAQPVGMEWHADVDAKTGRVYYTCDETLEVVWKRPTRGRILNEAQSGGDGKTGPKESLFEDEVKDEAPEVESAEAAAARMQEELKEVNCNVCGRMLWLPRRMEFCRHSFCIECFNSGPRYTKQCPVCGVDGNVEKMSDEHQANLEATAGAAERKAEYQAAENADAAATKLILEYGNTAVGEKGSAYAVEAFLRATKVEKGPASKLTMTAARAVVRVDFNINPDFPKSAIKVTNSPFTLSRTMALAFTCEMTAHFDERYGIPPVVIPYRIHHAPKTLRKVIVKVLPRPASMPPPPRHKKPSPVLVDHDSGIEVTVFV